MNHLMRAGLGAAAAVLALAFSSSALAATMNPRLDVGTSMQAGARTLPIEARLGSTDDWLGRLQIYMPAGYKLNAPPGGVQVGTAQATAYGTQIAPSQVSRRQGTITAIGTTDPAVAS